MDKEEKRTCYFSEQMSAAILYGGKSRRMGRDKGSLPVKDRTSFIEQLVEKLQVFDDLWLSLGRKDPCPHIKARRISDRYEGRGPMGGLESLLTVCRHDILFVTPVDTPFADWELAEELRQQMEREPELDALLMIDAQGRKQNLLGLYHRRILPLLRKELEEGEGKPSAYTMKDFLQTIRVRYVPAEKVSQGAIKTRTCNTIEEYHLIFPSQSELRPETGYAAESRHSAKTDYPLKNAAKDQGRIPVLSVTGWSGSGKTTLLEGLLPCLKEAGIRLACLKHDAHHFELDREGKDSYRLSQAGADMTGLFSKEKGVWMENRPVNLDQMLAGVHDVDLVLLEGGSLTDYPKLLVYRRALGKGLRLAPEDCLAVVSDDPVERAAIQFGFHETEAIAGFIIGWLNEMAVE